MLLRAVGFSFIFCLTPAGHHRRGRSFDDVSLVQLATPSLPSCVRGSAAVVALWSRYCQGTPASRLLLPLLLLLLHAITAAVEGERMCTCCCLVQNLKRGETLEAPHIPHPFFPLLHFLFCLTREQAFLLEFSNSSL